MSPEAFRAAAEAWHDFYVAAGSASAALLGLLFVGVSINIGTIAREERADVRTLANQAFSNLLYVLVLSLMALVGDPQPKTLAIQFGVIAGIGLLAVGRRLVGLIRAPGPVRAAWPTVRRIAWVVMADIVLLWLSNGLLASGDAGWLDAMLFVVLILLGGAADVSWELLVRVSREASPRDDAALVVPPADPAEGPPDPGSAPTAVDHAAPPSDRQGATGA